MDEAEVIAEMQARSQQELGGLTRPAFVAKANISDRKRIYKRVDRAYKSMRDPLAISADADARIAARIAALRQRVYASSRSTSDNFDRPVANNANSSSVSLSSAPVELTPIRDRWEDRDAALGGNPRQVTVEIIEVAPEPPSGSMFMPRQTTSNDVELNRR